MSAGKGKTERILDIFYKVKEHLLKQNAKSADGADCMYRDNTTGYKCAVGCLITDENYHEHFEGVDASDDEVITAVQRSGYPDLNDEELKLLRELQIIHDDFDCSTWENKLTELEDELLQESVTCTEK